VPRELYRRSSPSRRTRAGKKLRQNAYVDPEPRSPLRSPLPISAGQLNSSQPALPIHMAASRSRSACCRSPERPFLGCFNVCFITWSPPLVEPTRASAWASATLCTVVDHHSIHPLKGSRQSHHTRDEYPNGTFSQFHFGAFFLWLFFFCEVQHERSPQRSRTKGFPTIAGILPNAICKRGRRRSAAKEPSPREDAGSIPKRARKTTPTKTRFHVPAAAHSEINSRANLSLCDRLQRWARSIQCARPGHECRRRLQRKPGR